MRQGDERALGTVYDRHADRAYTLALAMLKAPADAEEVVADVFLQLWRTTGFDPERGSLGAYLTVATRSKALDRLRANRRRGRAEEASATADPSGLSLPVSHPTSPEHDVVRGDDRQRLGTAIGTLSEKQQTVIGLAYFEGLTHSEISERLSEPLGTVKTRLRDGMKKLRQAMSTATRSLT